MNDKNCQVCGKNSGVWGLCFTCSETFKKLKSLSLTEREARVFELVYYHNLSLDEIGKIKKISRERARQLKFQAIAKIEKFILI